MTARSCRARIGLIALRDDCGVGTLWQDPATLGARRLALHDSPGHPLDAPSERRARRHPVHHFDLSSRSLSAPRHHVPYAAASAVIEHVPGEQAIGQHLALDDAVSLICRHIRWVGSPLS
jgi:hypothetical protein